MQKLSKICDWRILEFTVSTLKRTEKVSFDRVESEVADLGSKWKVLDSWRWKWTVHSMEYIRLKIDPKSTCERPKWLNPDRLKYHNWTVFDIERSNWLKWPFIIVLDSPHAMMDRPLLVGPFSLNLAFSWNTVFIRVLSHLHHDQSKFMSHFNDSKVSILFLTAL